MALGVDGAKESLQNRPHAAEEKVHFSRDHATPQLVHQFKSPEQVRHSLIASSRMFYGCLCAVPDPLCATVYLIPRARVVSQTSYGGLTHF